MSRIKKQTFENRDKGQFVEIQCPTCERSTRHMILQSVDKVGAEYVSMDGQEVENIDWSDDYQIIECQGCGTASFRSVHYFSEADGTEERLYPLRTKDNVQAKDFWNVPPTLRRIYRETIDAYNYEANTLCAAGLRAIVEGVCAERGVKDGPVSYQKPDGTSHVVRKDNLEGKIAGLAEKNVLTEKNAAVLHAHRFLGNDAVHELQAPSVSELKLAVQIIEHVLDSLYELPETAAELQARRDSRKKAK